VSDLELLFLVLVCLYGWECACWLRRGSVGFRTWLGRRWRAVHPGALVGNQHGSFILAPPLPPLGYILTGNQFPLSLSAEGVFAYVSPTVNPGPRPQQTGLFFRFDKIQSAEVKGKKLLINGAMAVKAYSPGSAQYLASCVRQLVKAPASERAAAIEKIFRDTFDSKAAKNRWREFQKQTGAMRWLVNALFLYIFVLVPGVIWHLGLRLSWMGLLAGLLVLTASIAIEFRRAHKVFYPEAEDERFTHFLTTLLSPVTAIRAQDILSRPLLETFHPVAIAAVLCTPEEFRELAGRVVRDVQFPAMPVCPASQPEAESTERAARAALRKVLEAFLKRHKIEPDDLMRAPQPLDDACRAYCPRCLSQFTDKQGSCFDCGGLQLREFSPPLRA